MTGWVMIFWIYSNGPNGVTSGTIQYFLSEKACIAKGEKFKNNQNDRNYICVEAEVKETK